MIQALDLAFTLIGVMGDDAGQLFENGQLSMGLMHRDTSLDPSNARFQPGPSEGRSPYHWIRIKEGKHTRTSRVARY